VSKEEKKNGSRGKKGRHQRISKGTSKKTFSKKMTRLKHSVDNHCFHLKLNDDILPNMNLLIDVFHVSLRG
jgi:hypothetical protein